MILCVIMLGLAVACAFEKPLGYNEETVSYFKDNTEIKEKAVRFAKNLQRYYIYYANFDPELAEAKLKEIDALLGDSITSSSVANALESNVTQAPETLYQTDVRTQTREQLTQTREHLNDALTNYNTINQYIKANDDFHFLVYSFFLNRIIDTNSENFNTELQYESISVSDSLFDMQFNGQALNQSFFEHGLRCFIAIPESTGYEIKLNMDRTNSAITYNNVFSSLYTPIALAVVAALIVFLLAVFNTKNLMYYNGVLYSAFAELPVFVKFPLFCFFTSFAFQRIFANEALLTNFFITQNSGFLLLYIASCVALVFFYIMLSEHIVRLILKPSRVFEEKEFKHFPEVSEELKLALHSQKPVMTTLLIITVVFISINMVSIYIILFGLGNLYVTVLTYFALLLTLCVLSIIYKAIISEIKLRFYITELSEGRIESIPTQYGLFSKSINRLNDINNKFSQIMNERLKTERLKTDLITNVSHDLKTPLTSIISYVDLLKAMETDNAAAAAYIDIIKQKSTRLKILIDDLFEASKLSSGQMTLEIRRSDVVSLLEQTLGELDNTIEQSGIKFVVNTCQAPLYIDMDGQKMWRVFDNLINNIIKYSPKDSRAFIDMTEDESEVCIVFKNVANYTMDFEADDLFERFKRGDKARTTEGSGLGLSIAKSIIELHGGKMQIVTDGDLFKIIIRLNKPVTEEEAG